MNLKYELLKIVAHYFQKYKRHFSIVCCHLECVQYELQLQTDDCIHKFIIINIIIRPRILDYPAIKLTEL